LTIFKNNTILKHIKMRKKKSTNFFFQISLGDETVKMFTTTFTLYRVAKRHKMPHFYKFLASNEP